MEQSLRSALRDRTRGPHTRLDAALTGPGRGVRDLAAYVRVLTTLHALHRHADAPLAAWVHASPLATNLDPALVPDRERLYADDLRALGVPTGSAGSGHATAPADARGLALLYLVAGSAAGARVLLRGLPETIPTEARRGLTCAAGPTSTVLWRESCALLSQPVDGELQEAAVAEATAVLETLAGHQELVAS